MITDASGEPVIGAAVMLKGTNNGVVTDTNGRFEIEAPAGAVFSVSCIGYETVEITGQNGPMNISLADDVEMIDETVVIGYGSVKKSSLTGAVASVKMDNVEKTGSTDVASALMGRVAGLDVSQTAVSPDASFSMIIRGQASTGAGNAPLYVIDGFPGGDINSVNPNDIESIEVLKDASSTSIYGARAANGVILVTTKKGKEGTAVVNFKAYGSLQRIENPYHIMDASDYMNTVNGYYYEKWLYNNKIAPYGTTDPSTVTNVPTYPFTAGDIANATNTDYWDLMTRTGVINEEDLSISGGTDKTHYLLSLGHYRQDGVIRNSDHEKFMFRVNMDYKFNKWLTTGVTASGTRSDYHKLQTSSSSDNLSIINSIISFPNYIEPYDEAGNYQLNPQHGQNNPLSLLEMTNHQVSNRFLLNNYWTAQILPELVARVSWGLNYGETRKSDYYPKTTYTGSQTNSKATVSQSTRNDYLLDATLTYSKTFAEIHALKLMAGYAYQKYTTDYFSAGNSDFLSDSFNVYNLGGGGDLTKTVGSSLSINKYVSWFGRVNYDLMDRYLFTFTVRADGSDRFGTSNRYGVFPSVAFAWRISQEPWMKNVSWVSNLKLRASWGQTGNAEIGGNAYGYYKTGTNAVIGGSLVSGVSESQLSNIHLKWETTTEYNFGLDFGFFRNRITGTVEYFHKVINDLLDSRSVGSYYPVSTVADNLGSTQSTGVEFQLTTRNIVTQDFQWTTDLTLSHYKDRWKDRNPYTILAVYQGNTDPLHITWGYKTDGLIQAGETVAWDAKAAPGSIKIVDINGDDKIDDNDKTIICNSAPALTLGFNNTFNWKQFDLSLFFYGAFGQQRYNYTLQDFLKPSRLDFLDNISMASHDMWSSTNKGGKYPNGFYTKWESASDFWVENASFLRLKHLTLGYTLPKNVIKGLSHCRFYLDAQNLFCITNYSGVDPEADSFAAYPNQRTFSLGIDITF
ncbi:MAG: TonB-dependent receptor [Bacteroidales bacterium]|nr:TonB-dependent receptor [Bacteroidales bacterium]